MDFKIRNYWANYIDEVCGLGGFLINGTDFVVVGKQNAWRAPATKLLRKIKRLKASQTGGFLRSNTPGSTVEARGFVVGSNVTCQRLDDI